MLDLMFEIPSRRDIKEAVVTEGVILKKESRSCVPEGEGQGEHA
jgi:ATP-dependent protease Clp ATPase subunit